MVYRYIPPEVFIPLKITGLVLVIGGYVHLVCTYPLFWAVALIAANVLQFFVILRLCRKNVFHGGDARAYLAANALMPCVPVAILIMLVSVSIGGIYGCFSRNQNIKNRGVPLYCVIAPVTVLSLVGYCIVFIL